MKTNRVSLGFGLRLSPEVVGTNRFPENQRLVSRSLSPICADPNVWNQPEEVESLTKRIIPDFANPLGLAKNIGLLIDACKKRSIPTTGLWPICVTSSDANLIPLEERYGPGYFNNQPEEDALLTSQWQFLGIDVVDLHGLISGLKGCGYVEPSWSQLRDHFRGDLNEFGLFRDAMAAFEFAQVRGSQIRGHAPFVVVGLLKNDPL